MVKIKLLYKNSKLAKVGSSCKCPSCGSEFVKTNYQQAFCKTKKGTICKDQYWNTVTPKKRNNTTRISPANSSWMATKKTRKSSRLTSGGYIIRNGVAYNEFDEPVYNVDINDDNYDHGQWNE